MRILALTNLYPNPWQPQRATYNRRDFKALAKLCPLRVIAPIAWPDELRARRAGKPALPASRRVELDGLTVDHPRVFHTPGVLRGWYGRFFYWSVRSTFRRVLREFEPSIVYAPWVYPDGWAAIRLAREAGLPVVLQALGSDVLLLGQHPRRRAGTVQALKTADGVAAVSRNLADKMIALGADKDRVRVIYSGVDTGSFQPGCKLAARQALGITGEAAQLLFIGNLVPVKGIDVLLKACAHLQSQGRDFQLQIIGDGPLQQQLSRLSETLGIAGRVNWRGSIPQAQLPDWYRAADVCVLPSRSEGVPNVLLEASGCETPWVATRVGGIPEIAHLGANRLVAVESVDELGGAIETMLVANSSSGQRPRSPEVAVLETREFLAEIEEMSRQSRFAVCA